VIVNGFDNKTCSSYGSTLTFDGRESSGLRITSKYSPADNNAGEIFRIVSFGRLTEKNRSFCKTAFCNAD